LFAALLLAPLALGGCNDNPIGSGGSTLVGSWATEEIQLNTTAPNGSTNVRYQEERTYEFDGTFHHTDAIIDATTGRRWVVHARTGTWRASKEVLRELTRAFYVFDPTQPSENPVLTPIVDPQVSQLSYELEGTTLLLTVACPPNANCIAAHPLHRVPTL
jgi:hypothetical protein